MDRKAIDTIRSFNRRVTQAVGVLQDGYLALGRPLAEARVLFEIAGGADVSQLRSRLGLDSGYLSRLLRSLEGQGLIHVTPASGDARRRIAALTARGSREQAKYDLLSDELARSTLQSLDDRRRGRLLAAAAEVTRLLAAAAVAIEEAAPDSPEGIAARSRYFAELASRFENGFDAATHDPAGPGSDGDMNSPSGCFLIARLDGEVVGCGGMKRLDARSAEIKRVWTAPPSRGLGIASRIVAALEQRARAKGVKRMVLDTNRALGEARQMYCRLGYREIGRYNDNPYADYWFAKEL